MGGAEVQERIGWRRLVTAGSAEVGAEVAPTTATPAIRPNQGPQYASPVQNQSQRPAPYLSRHSNTSANSAVTRPGFFAPSGDEVAST